MHVDSSLVDANGNSLRDLLEAQQRLSYGRGVLFPDSSALFLGFNKIDYGHEDDLINAYIQLIANRCPSGDLSTTECQELTAHFMGMLAHVITDMRFDRFFLSRVDVVCGFNDGGSGDAGDSQRFTDATVDTALADEPSWMYARPRFGGIPGEPWYGGLNGGNPTCSDCVTPWHALHDAFPGVFGTKFKGMRTGSVLHVADFVVLLEKGTWATDARKKVKKKNCSFSLCNVRQNLGGFEDSGEISAQYINKTYEILRAGGVPTYESVGGGAYGQRFAVFDENGRAFDYASWVTLSDGGVTKFQIVDDRVYWLGGVGSANELWTDQQPFDRLGPLDATCEDPALASTKVPSLVSDGVIDFQVDDSVSGQSGRLGLLVEDGRQGPGGDLLVAANYQTSPIFVAQDVVDFWMTTYGEFVSQQRQRLVFLVRSPGASTSKLMLRDGDSNQPIFKLLEGSIQEVQLEGDRIAALRGLSAGASAPQELLIWEGKTSEVVGGATAAFSARKGHIQQFKLDAYSDNRWVWVLEGGELSQVKWTLDSPVVHVMSNVSEFQAVEGWVGAVTNQRLLLHRGLWPPSPCCGASNLCGSAGPPYQWVDLAAVTYRFELQAGMVLTDDKLWGLQDFFAPGGVRRCGFDERNGLPAFSPDAQLQQDGQKVGFLSGGTLYHKEMP